MSEVGKKRVHEDNIENPERFNMEYISLTTHPGQFGSVSTYSFPQSKLIY